MRTRKSIIALCLVLVAAMVSVAGSGAVVNRGECRDRAQRRRAPVCRLRLEQCARGRSDPDHGVGRRVPHVHPPGAGRARRRDAASAHHRPPWSVSRRRAPGAEQRLGTARDRDGIVVVYPQGIDSTWNIGVGSPDVAYFGQLLDETEAALCIDTNRVYVDGFSLGAFLTSAIVCTYADRIAAVAPIAGIYVPSGCTPARPVPALTIHGTLDNWVGYTSIPGKVAAWAARNGCGATPTTEAVPGDDVVNITKFTYDCPASAEVEFYSIENGGHAWPGSEFSRAIEAAVGYTTFAITATDLIWDFFRSHQLHPDIATYTARLSAAAQVPFCRGSPRPAGSRSPISCASAWTRWTRSPPPGSVPTPAPAPANDGPFWVTVQLAGGRGGPHRCRGRGLGVDGDALHNLGGRLVNRIVFLAAIGRL